MSFPNFSLDEAVLYESQQEISGKMLFSDTCNTEPAIESGLVKRKIWETRVGSITKDCAEVDHARFPEEICLIMEADAPI